MIKTEIEGVLNGIPMKRNVFINNGCDKRLKKCHWARWAFTQN